MPIENYDLVGSYNQQRVVSLDAERSVNCFEYNDPLGKKPKALFGTSGVKNSGVDFGATIDGFRASFFFGGKMYHVIGATVWVINLVGSALVPTLIFAGLTTTTGYVGVDANTFQIIFVDGQRGYIYDTTTNVFVQITDASFPANPIDVCYLDGFFIVAHGGTNQFQLSSFNQGLVWGPDNAGTPNTFTLAAGSSDLTLTAGSTINYQIGTPVVISGSTIAEIPNGTYYVVLVSSPTVFRVSATLGGSPISSVAGGGGSLTNNGQLQEAQITTHPGTIVACRTLHRRLFLFSQFFTEVWENAGIGTNLPFRRNNSLLMEYGTVAIGSVSVGFDKMFFLAQDRDGLGSVMEVIGTESIPVSTRAVDFQLAQYAELGQVADCRAFLIKENGLIFYRMNFTLANNTFVYNVTLSNPQQDPTKFWHEEGLLNGDRHPAQTHVYFNGINYVGHWSIPRLYIIDSALVTNDGEHIHRLRIGRPFVPPGYQRIRVNRFQVDFLQGQNHEFIFDNALILTETGLQNLTTETSVDIVTEQTISVHQDLTPVAFLSISKDGGQTYGNVLTAPMGDIGQRTFRTVWRKLGVTPRGQAFVPQLEFFNELPFAVLGAAWDYDILPE